MTGAARADPELPYRRVPPGEKTGIVGRVKYLFLLGLLLAGCSEKSDGMDADARDGGSDSVDAGPRREPSLRAILVTASVVVKRILH